MRRRMMEAAMEGGAGGFPERVFRMHGGLRFYVLWLLPGKTMNGSEIIEQIESQTNGMWRPSPGSIYPLLKSLEEEGLVNRGEDGRYAITDQGKEQTRWIRGDDRGQESGKYERMNEAIEEMESMTSYLEDNVEDLKQFPERMSALVKRLEAVTGRLN